LRVRVKDFVEAFVNMSYEQRNVTMADATDNAADGSERAALSAKCASADDASAVALPAVALPTTFDFYFQTLLETSTETLSRGLNVLVAEFGKSVLIPRLYAEQPSLALELPMTSALNCADRWLAARKAGEAMPAPVPSPPSAAVLAAAATKRKAEEAAQNGPPAKKTYYTPYELSLLQIHQLKKLCELNGVKRGGRKGRLIDNLCKHDKPIETVEGIAVSDAKKAKKPMPTLRLPTADEMQAGGMFGGFGGGGRGGGMFGGGSALLAAMGMCGRPGGPSSGAGPSSAGPSQHRAHQPMTITQLEDDDDGEDDDDPSSGAGPSSAGPSQHRAHQPMTITLVGVGGR
jgi:hypothetical protein